MGVFESGGEGEYTTMIESLQNKELWEKYCDERTSKEWNTDVKISEKRCDQREGRTEGSR